MSLQQVNSMPQNSPPETAYVLGVRVDRVSQAQALDKIEQMISQHRASLTSPREVTTCSDLPWGGQACQQVVTASSSNKAHPPRSSCGGQACQQVVTVNPEFVMAAQRNADFLAAINSAALVLADGAGVVWATRYLGQPTPERLTGTDLLPLLAERCALSGYRLYLLGAAPGIAEAAAERLQAIAPGLEIAGTYAGSPALHEEDEIIARIRAARADVLCVAYGAPAQELWIWRNLARLPVAVAIGVGGAFDFVSGRKPRAPEGMRRVGLEWLYRLYREPWRWRRMLALPRFAVQVVLRGRKHYDA